MAGTNFTNLFIYLFPNVDIIDFFRWSIRHTHTLQYSEGRYTFKILTNDIWKCFIYYLCTISYSSIWICVTWKINKLFQQGTNETFTKWVEFIKFLYPSSIPLLNLFFLLLHLKNKISKIFLAQMYNRLRSPKKVEELFTCIEFYYCKRKWENNNDKTFFYPVNPGIFEYKNLSPS